MARVAFLKELIGYMPGGGSPLLASRGTRMEKELSLLNPGSLRRANMGHTEVTNNLVCPSS
jgi:hypothetical protein